MGERDRAGALTVVRRRGSRGGVIARRALERALVAQGVDAADRDAIGWVRYLGQGVDYTAWTAVCDGPGGEARQLVVRIPRAPVEPAQAASARREARLLEVLGGLELPWSVPEQVACVDLDEGVALVQGVVSGSSAETRAALAPTSPWEVFGPIAATIHGIAPRLVERVELPGHATRRAHAEALLPDLAAFETPEAEVARQWAEAHLPPATPARLLHGDLHRENVRWDVLAGRYGVLDWTEAQLGDPAYDLAQLTRGSRRPFQRNGGLRRLLQAYAEQALDPVTPTEVQLYELCRAGRIYGGVDPERVGLREDLRRRFAGLVARIAR